jgi:hypothetical protein
MTCNRIKARLRSSPPQENTRHGWRYRNALVKLGNNSWTVNGPWVLVSYFRSSEALPTKGLILHSWNSRGRHDISPASRQRTAHSSRLRYWSKLAMLPSHSVPDEVVITTTFGTSHGPTQPLTVNCTRFSNPRFRHSLFSHSTGTSGRPRSTLPQQQPRQIVICPTTRRFVFNGQSRSSFTVPDPSLPLKAAQSKMP